MVLQVLFGRKTQGNPPPTKVSGAPSLPLELFLVVPPLGCTRVTGQALQVKLGRKTKEHPRSIQVPGVLSATVHVGSAVLRLLIVPAISSRLLRAGSALARVLRFPGCKA